MPNVTPIQQPPVEDLRNGLMICEAWESPELSDSETAVAFASVARLIRHAIEGLSEPNLASVQATAILLREARNELPGVADEPRYARDTAAAILHAAVTGVVPGTWSGAVG